MCNVIRLPNSGAPYISTIHQTVLSKNRLYNQLHHGPTLLGVPVNEAFSQSNMNKPRPKKPGHGSGHCKALTIQPGLVITALVLVGTSKQVKLLINKPSLSLGVLKTSL